MCCVILCKRERVELTRTPNIQYRHGRPTQHVFSSHFVFAVRRAEILLLEKNRADDVSTLGDPVDPTPYGDHQQQNQH